MENNKQKIVAGLLALFFGGYGVHNFYLGYTKKAVIQLVCTLVCIILSATIVGAVIGIPGAFGIGVWALVEAIMIFTGKIATDANGNLLV